LHPMTTPQMVTYAWRQLARRAGIVHGGATGTGFEALGVAVQYAAPEQVQADSHNLIVVPCRAEAWQELLERNDRSLTWIEPDRLVPNGVHLPFSDSVPVLFWGDGYEDGRKSFAERREDGAVVFYADILAATLFMLSRWEEMVVPARDSHDRFPATASVAFRQGFLDRPIIDEYGLILQAWLKVLRPGWQPTTARFSVKLSHDIDMVRSHASLYSATRTCAGDLLKRRSLAKAVQTLCGFISPAHDPKYRGILDLAELSQRHGLVSAFYFMGAKAGPYDRGYDPSSTLVSKCMRDLTDRGHEIGFHAGYYTLDDPKRFAWEKSRVEEITGNGKMGGRQHCLRFRVPDTWRTWDEAGMAYDSTLGYADHEGFRCGTCHPFHPFDIERGRELNLTEVPLIAMDVTLRQYRSLTPEQAEKRILLLAERCRRVNGVFTLLWHNSSLQDEWEPWATAYNRVLRHLTSQSAHGLHGTGSYRKSEACSTTTILPRGDCRIASLMRRIEP
jgi:hypothetical protein